MLIDIRRSLIVIICASIWLSCTLITDVDDIPIFIYNLYASLIDI